MRSGCVVVVLAAAITAAAPAGTPVRWEVVSTTGIQKPVGEIGHARLDGVLHVTWGRRAGPSSYDLVHTQISASGTVGPSEAVVTGWVGAGSSALFIGPNRGLWVFFPGSRTTDPNEPHFGLNFSARSVGQPWMLHTPSYYRDQFAHGRTPAAAALTGNRAIAAWDGRDGVGVFPVHHGTFVTGYGPSGTSAACCRHGVNIVVGASDRTMLAWCAMNEAPNGIWAQEVNPVTGAPVGAAMRMPGSTNAQGQRICDVGQRVPLVAGRGGGFFIAAKDGAERAILVWRVGTPRSDRITAGPAFRRVGLAAAPDDRLWVGWSRFLTASRLYLRRSNRRGTVFGATVQRPGPAGAVEVQVIDLSAQRDRVDILGTYSAVAGSNLFHSQALPGLTLAATGGKILRFRVTDAGDPIAGARVSVGGRNLVTDGAGRASVDLRPGRYTAAATKSGYVGATKRVRAR